MFYKLLTDYCTNDVLFSDIKEAVVAFNKSKLNALLKQKNRTVVAPQTPHTDPLAITALNAAYAGGYQECLDDIEYFLEKYAYPLQKNTSNESSRLPDYGGLGTALKNKDITQEEYDRLKLKPKR